MSAEDRPVYAAEAHADLQVPEAHPVAPPDADGLDLTGFKPAPPRLESLGHAPGPADARIHAVGDRLLVDCYVCPERFPIEFGTVDEIIDRLVAHGEQVHPELGWAPPRWE